MLDPSQRLADEQTAAERRALRADYRAIYGKVVEGKEQLANAATSELVDVIGRVGALHARAQRPKEYAVDAEVFAQLAACGLDMVRRGAAKAAQRTPADFVAQLRAIRASGGGSSARAAAAAAAARASNANSSGDPGPQMDWASIGAAAIAAGYSATAPGAATMYGPLGEAPKPPTDKKMAAAAAAAARRAAGGANKRRKMSAEEMEAAAGPKVRPHEVTDDLGAANPEGDDKQETDRQMDAMWCALMDRAEELEEQQEQQRRRRAGQEQEEDEGGGEAGTGASAAFVDVAALVVNHQSFAQTVENLFTLSFLVRDQRVRLEYDPDLGLVVRPFSLEQQRAIKEGLSAEAAAAGAGVAAAADGGGRDGGRARGGGRQQQQQHQQQRLAHQFVVRFTHEDWEVMKELVRPGKAVTPHRALGANLAGEEAREQHAAKRAEAAAAAAAAARAPALAAQEQADKQLRAAGRQRRQAERAQAERALKELNKENDEGEEGDGGLLGKKRARDHDAAAAAGGEGAGAGGGGGDDIDVVDNHSGKSLRV